MAEVDQHNLQGRKDWIGEQDPENSEECAHQQLHREQHRGREVDRAPGDKRHDDISVDIVHQEIDDDAPDALTVSGTEADRDHQHARGDRADVRDEGEDSGDKPEQSGHRHSEMAIYGGK